MTINIVTIKVSSLHWTMEEEVEQWYFRTTQWSFIRTLCIMMAIGVVVLSEKVSLVFIKLVWIKVGTVLIQL